jgi:hypothetical protein
MYLPGSKGLSHLTLFYTLRGRLKPPQGTCKYVSQLSKWPYQLKVLTYNLSTLKSPIISHSPLSPSLTKRKNVWSFHSICFIGLHGVMLGHRDHFTLGILSEYCSVVGKKIHFWCVMCRELNFLSIRLCFVDGKENGCA